MLAKVSFVRSDSVRRSETDYQRPWTVPVERFRFPDSLLPGVNDAPKWTTVELMANPALPLYLLYDEAGERLEVEAVTYPSDSPDKRVSLEIYELYVAHSRGVERISFVLDDQLRATWSIYAPEVRLSDLQLLQAEGLLQGDPLHLVIDIDPVVRGPGVGNGFSLWQNVSTVYDAIGQVIVLSGGLYGGIRGFADVFKGVCRFIDRHGMSFERRRCGVSEVEVLVKLADPKKLAAYLAVPEEDATELLVGLGLISDGTLSREAEDAFTRARTVARVSTHYYLDESKLREAAEKAMRLPKMSQVDFEATTVKIFKEFRGSTD